MARQLFVRTDDFIGRGRFSTVLEGKFKDSIQVAVKRITKRKIHVASNVYLMTGEHRNIVKYYSTDDSSDVDFS